MINLIKIILITLIFSSISLAQSGGNCWIFQQYYNIVIDFYPQSDNTGNWIMLINYNGETPIIVPHYSNNSIYIDMDNVYLYGYCYVDFYYLSTSGYITYSNPDLLLF